MAKKKDDDVPAAESGPEAFTRQLFADVEKDYGEGVLISGHQAMTVKPQIIPWSPALDIILSGGIEEGSAVGITGNPKTGKAQPLDSIVQTPEGPRRMGDIRPGDRVCAPTGTSVVESVHPQGVVPIYRVLFAGGDSVECCDEHLWEVHAAQRKNPEVIPLKEFRDNLWEADGRSRWSVRLPVACEYDFRETPLDPYLVGVLIGDGCLRGHVGLSTADEELSVGVGVHIEKPYGWLKITGTKYDYRLTRGGRTNKYAAALRELGLYNLKSRDKFVPDIYKFNSEPVRWAVLQGLMDTDGTVDAKGNLSFSTASTKLAADMKWLVQSLGGLCTITPKVTTCNGKKFDSFNLAVKLNDPRNAFRLSRKLDRCKVRRKPPLRRRIIGVEFVGNKEAQCIKIASPDGLYLTDHHVVTHNTSACLSFAANAQKPEYGARPIYYAKVEGRLSLTHLKGIKGLDLSEGKFNIIQSTKKKILSAQDYLRIMESVIKNVPGAVVIIDSISALCDEKEQAEGVGTETRGGGAKLFSQWCRLLNQVVPVNGTIVMGITHLISNTSGMGAMYTERAARMWLYQKDYDLRTVQKTAWKVNEQQIGLDIRWACNTSKNGPPGMTINSYLRFGVGIDRLFEVINMGIQTGLIKKAGSWLQLTYLDDAPKFQGSEKVYEALNNRPEWAAALEQKVLGMAGALAGSSE